ncbi:MAG: deoxyribose-phosphate aldolase [Prevotellaceae bacterium]|jgi:deoxyribose-phosphate aldolase|nr:deoxyribose-phosphate aldolase [Prevotellaceae bacterium]
MKNYTRAEVAATIDHAVLKPDMTVEDIEKNAKMCLREQVASMCVRPCDVASAARLLKDSNVKVSCVLSFPHGADATPVKAFQAKQAIADGTDEIDMVMNIGRFLSGDYDYVEKDIRAVVETAHGTGKNQTAEANITKVKYILVKVILESGFLTPEQVAKACELAYQAGADFVKTSTGFGPGSATPETVDVMLKTVGDKMGVKPSGGIRDWATAVGYLQQGVQRLGVGSTEAVLNGAPEEENPTV